MDKLKPILTHKFWIISFVALIVPLVGWVMMSGAAADAYEQGKTDLDGAFSKINAGKAVTPEWAEKLAEVNKVADADLDRAAGELYERQKSLKTWPAIVASVMADCPEFSAPERSDNQTQSTPILWRKSYPSQIQELYAIPEPVYEIMEAGQIKVVGKVDFEPSAIPQTPVSTWESAPPSWEEMWNEQQDIWLLRSLLTSVRRVNAGSKTIRDSTIRKISSVSLFSGTRIEPGSEGGSGGGDGESSGGSEDMAGMEADYGDQGSGGGFGDQGEGGQTGVSAEIDLADDFSNVDERGGSKGEGTGGDEMASNFGGGDYGEMEASDGSGGGTVEEAEPPSRYVDDEEDQPYRTRGFKMSVVMDQQRIPDFLTELVNLPWPVEIIRVHFAQVNSDSTGVGSQGGMMTYGGGEMGASGGRRGFGTGGSRRGGFGSDTEDYGSDAAPGGEGFGAEGPGGPGRGQESLQRVVSVALAEPQMAEVVVVGLMTMYREPENEEAADETVAEDTTNAADSAPAGDSAAESGTEPQPANEPAATAPAADDGLDSLNAPSDSPAEEAAPETAPGANDGTEAAAPGDSPEPAADSPDETSGLQL